MYKPAQLKQDVETLVGQDRLEEARNILIAAERDQPGDSEVQFLLGTVESVAGNLTSAKTWLEKSANGGSRNPLCYLRLGYICSELGQYSEAERYCRESILIQPHLAPAHQLLSGLLKMQQKFKEAGEHLGTALRLQPNADGYADMARLYERLNRPDDAARMAKHALQLEPGNISAIMALGSLEKRAGNLDQAEALFRTVALNPKRDSRVGDASMSLGQVLDRQGRYAEAFTAFEAGNAISSQIANEMQLDRQKMRKQIASSAEYVASGRVGRWDNQTRRSDPRQPPIFFVGFPRSGTTLVERILDQHPLIASSQERPFIHSLVQQLSASVPQSSYPQYLDGLTADSIDRLKTAYWSRAERAISELTPDRILVDKLPLNIISLLPARIFPDARILVALRDPRDVCLSCFMQAFALNTAMVNFLTLESTARFYSDVMGFWLEYRSVLPNRWLQYRYEDLIDDFDGVARGIFDFLSLEYPENATEYHASTRNKLLATPSYQDVSTPIYTRAKARWENYGVQLEPVMHYLEPFIKEFGYPL